VPPPALGQGGGDAAGLAGRERPGSQQLAQRVRVDPLADHPGMAVVFAGVEDAHEAGVGDLGGAPGGGHHLRRPGRVGREGP
jgi:hypothetical protein